MNCLKKAPEKRFLLTDLPKALLKVLAFEVLLNDLFKVFRRLVKDFWKTLISGSVEGGRRPFLLPGSLPAPARTVTLLASPLRVSLPCSGSWFVCLVFFRSPTPWLPAPLGVHPCSRRSIISSQNRISNIEVVVI